VARRGTQARNVLRPERTTTRRRDVARTSIHIDAHPEDVFAVLADGAGYADWVVSAKEILDADVTFPRVGARLRAAMGLFAFTVNAETRVVRAEPPSLLELDIHAKHLRARVRYELEPDAAGTTVVMEEDGTNALSRSLMLMPLIRVLVLGRNAETLWRLRSQIANGSDTDRPMPTPVPTRVAVPRWLGDVTARGFGLVAAARGARALHPRGVTRTGRALLTARGATLAGGPAAAVVVRFSRAVGLPAWLPDINGIAVRFVDARGPGLHRDVLFATAGTGPLRRLIVPAVDFGAPPFSTVLRYRLNGTAVLLMASVSGRGVTLDRLRCPDPVDLRLSAVGAGGLREHLGDVHVEGLVDGSAIRFDPTAADPEFTPVGFLNALRAPAYAASQAVRAGSTRPPPEP